ncbi:MAG: TlpA family protein disulfide reductase [Nitrospira sp.]|nr:TlpA family protein disulfide reductase [Nitrospira sp.]
MRTIGFMIAMLMLAGVLPAGSASDPAAMLKIGSVMGVDETPVFQMRALDGREIDSAELKGKVVVLNFWATWCGPCKEEMPALERLRRQVDGDKVVLAAVTTDMQRDGIRAFVKQLGLNFPIWLDEDRSVSAAFLVRGLPTTVFIGADGRLAGRAVGPRDWDSADAVAFVKSLEGTR